MLSPTRQKKEETSYLGYWISFAGFVIIIFIIGMRTNSLSIDDYKKNQPVNNVPDANTTEPTTNNAKQVQPAKTLPECNKFSAEQAVREYLMNTGVIQYPRQIDFERSIKLTDNCDYKVTVKFYLHDLIDGDGTRIFKVGFDGNKYFVY